MKSKVMPILQVFSFIFLFAAAFSARAEYYLVYPDPGYYYVGGCNHCCHRCCRSYCYEAYPTTVVYMHFSSPRRHDESGSGEMGAYAWVPTPEAP